MKQKGFTIYPRAYSLCSKSGFTLIEILIIAAIIGILATVVLSALGVARNRARYANAIHEMQQLPAAMEIFNIDNGGFGVLDVQYTCPGTWSASPDNGFETRNAFNLLRGIATSLGITDLTDTDQVSCFISPNRGEYIFSIAANGPFKEIVAEGIGYMGSLDSTVFNVCVDDRGRFIRGEGGAPGEMYYNLSSPYSCFPDGTEL